MTKTDNLKYLPSKIWRYQLKLKLLEIFQDQDRPLTVGDLFLLTRGQNHTVLLHLLRELHDANYIGMAIREAQSKTYHGANISYSASYYYLKPDCDPTPLRETLRELTRLQESRHE